MFVFVKSPAAVCIGWFELPIAAALPTAKSVDFAKNLGRWLSVVPVAEHVFRHWSELRAEQESDFEELQFFGSILL
jgi:hypothetical protein